MKAILVYAAASKLTPDHAPVRITGTDGDPRLAWVRMHLVEATEDDLYAMDQAAPLEGENFLNAIPENVTGDPRDPEREAFQAKNDEEMRAAVAGYAAQYRLCDAAPALLAALEALLDKHAANSLFDNSGHWEQARAAIALTEPS